jgi:hypothetical protein
MIREANVTSGADLDGFMETQCGVRVCGFWRLGGGLNRRFCAK